MEYNSGSNGASNFKSDEREARGRFEITSKIQRDTKHSCPSYSLSKTQLRALLSMFPLGSYITSGLLAALAASAIKILVIIFKNIEPGYITSFIRYYQEYIALFSEQD